MRRTIFASSIVMKKSQYQLYSHKIGKEKKYIDNNSPSVLPLFVSHEKENNKILKVF